jgi:nicotinamidase-related amidase
MHIERRTPQNTAIVIVDPVSDYAGRFRSHSVEENVNVTVALVKTALGFGLPLVVTAMSADGPGGTLYRRVAEALGDHPVVRRLRCFDAFDDAGFEKVVRETGVKHLVIAGLLTEGSVLQTTLGALRRDYTVSLVLDAGAGESEVQHQAAVARLTKLGVIPVTWLSLATELQRSYQYVETVDAFYDLLSQSPIFAHTSTTRPTHHDLTGQPASIVEMRLAHDVHRLASRVLADSATRPDAPAAALRQVRDFLVTTLRHHHMSEDEQLWPLVTSLVPATAEALEALTEEHELLEAALTELKKAEINDGPRHSSFAEVAARVLTWFIATSSARSGFCSRSSGSTSRCSSGSSSSTSCAAPTPRLRCT